MSRKTSITAYRSIEADGTLGRLQFATYDWLFHNGPATTRQVHAGIRHIARDVGIVSTRLTELTAMGVVEELGVTPCATTRKEVILWDVTDRLPIKTKKAIKKTKDQIIEELTELLSRRNDQLRRAVVALKKGRHA